MADVDPRDMEVPMATSPETPQAQNNNAIKETWSCLEDEIPFLAGP